MSLAVVLVLLGALCLSVAAALVDVRLGLAVAGVALLVGGLVGVPVNRR